MKKDLIKIFDKYDYAYYSFDLDQPIKDLLIEIENDLLRKSYSVDMCRSLIVDLWQYERELLRRKFESTEEFKTIVSEILEDEHYKEQEKFIVYNGLIPCSAMKTHTGFHILNDKQIKSLLDMGYGVTNFKIEKSETIISVNCAGKHPNIDTFSKSFCLGSGLTGMTFSKFNIELIEQACSQFNMTSVFIEQDEYDKIVGVLNER